MLISASTSDSVSCSTIHSAITSNSFGLLLFNYFFSISVIIICIIHVAFLFIMNVLDDIIMESYQFFTPEGDKSDSSEQKQHTNDMPSYKFYPAIWALILFALMFKVYSNFFVGFLKELIYNQNIYHLHDALMFLNTNSFGNVDTDHIYKIHECVIASIINITRILVFIIVAFWKCKAVMFGEDDKSLDQMKSSSDKSNNKKDKVRIIRGNGIGVSPMIFLLGMVVVSAVGCYFINKAVKKPTNNLYKNTYNEITQVAFMINRSKGLKDCIDILNNTYDDSDFATQLNELAFSVLCLLWVSICFWFVFLFWEFRLTRDVIFSFDIHFWLPVKTFVIAVFSILYATGDIFNSITNFYDSCSIVKGNLRNVLPEKVVGKLNYFELGIDKLYVGARKFDGLVNLFENVDGIKSAIFAEDMVRIFQMINSVRDKKNRNILMDIYNECLLFKDVRFKISPKEFSPSLVVDNKVKKTYRIVVYDRLLKYDDNLVNNDYIKVVEFGDSLYIKNNRVFCDDKPISICGFYIEDGKLFTNKGDEIIKGEKLLLKNGSVMSVFIGSSGGGKSTIVQHLFGLRSSNQVDTRLNGVPLRDIIVNNFSKFVCCIPQSPMIINNLTVMNNFACFGATNVDKNKEILKQLGIFDVLKRAIENNTIFSNIYMSGGQKVRFSLAMALAADANPDFILIDEAISALSSVAQSELVNLFNAWNKAFVVIEHVGEFIKVANIKIEVGNYSTQYFVSLNGQWCDLFSLKNLNKVGDHISCDDVEVYLDYTDNDPDYIIEDD